MRDNLVGVQVPPSTIEYLLGMTYTAVVMNRLVCSFIIVVSLVERPSYLQALALAKVYAFEQVSCQSSFPRRMFWFTCLHLLQVVPLC